METERLTQEVHIELGLIDELITSRELLIKKVELRREATNIFECRDSALWKFMILFRNQPTTKKFCPQNYDRRSVADFPHPAFARWRNEGRFS